MSYCRWSSDNFQCDLYCYESIGGGYIIHVANNKIVGDIPKLPDISDPSWTELYKKQMEFIDTSIRQNIGLPYDGMTFTEITLEDFLNRLIMLKETGYKFPDYVIEHVKKEIQDINKYEINRLEKE